MGLDLDAGALKPVLVRTAMTLAAALLLVIGAGMYHERMARLQQAASADLRGVVEAHREVLQEREVVRTELGRYEELRAHGFVGPEPRLLWVESVRESARRVGLPALHYQIAQRRGAGSGTVPDAGPFTLYTTRMDLRLDLHHEGELLDFFRVLDGERAGLYDLTACTLRRSGDDGTLHKDRPNLSAQCVLHWYTLDHDTPAAPEPDA